MLKVWRPTYTVPGIVSALVCFRCHKMRDNSWSMSSCVAHRKMSNFHLQSTNCCNWLACTYCLVTSSLPSAICWVEQEVLQMSEYTCFCCLYKCYPSVSRAHLGNSRAEQPYRIIYPCTFMVMTSFVNFIQGRLGAYLSYGYKKHLW